MGACFKGRRHARKPRSRWEDAVWRDDIDLLQILNWKAAARNREGWRKVIGKVMARKRVEVSQKKKKPQGSHCYILFIAR